MWNTMSMLVMLLVLLLVLLVCVLGWDEGSRVVAEHQLPALLCFTPSRLFDVSSRVLLTWLMWQALAHRTYTSVCNFQAESLLTSKP
jgi:hypothetical protein